MHCCNGPELIEIVWSVPNSLGMNEFFGDCVHKLE